MNSAGLPYDPFSVEAVADPGLFYALRDHFSADYVPEHDTWAISGFGDVWDGLMDAANVSEVEGQIVGKPRALSPSRYSSSKREYHSATRGRRSGFPGERRNRRVRRERQIGA